MNKLVYINSVQAKIREAIIYKGFKTVVAICGRGLGKSTILGDYFFNCVDTMPRARGWLGGPDHEAIKNRILPSIQEHWERLGLLEGKDEDYVVGQRPPKHWESPFNKITKYDNVISFWNGTTIDLLSFYSDKSGRGGNYQFGAGDEMGWVKRENFAQAVFPAMRGLLYKVALLEEERDENGQIPTKPFGEIIQEGLDFSWRIPFRENPFYQSIMMVSSMPYLEKGKWLLDYEHDDEVFYIEGTALDNIDVLGPDYIPRQQQNLTELEFRIEIMNERMTRREDGFYAAFDDDKHVISTNHYDVNLPIKLGFDFGKFSCIVVGQDIKDTCDIFDTYYVKNGDIEALTKQFVETYKDHKNKFIHLSGDVMGNKPRNPDYSTKTWWQTIEDILIKEGWTYRRNYHPFNPPHLQKHMIIREALQETKGLVPVRIHERNCMNLILSMKDAPMKEDGTKDKKSEHPKDETPEERATHFSDAFDYLYIDQYGRSFKMAKSNATKREIYLG